MNSQNYKIKLEYGVSIVVLLIGVFFLIQAFTIDTSKEAVGPRTVPMFLAIALIVSGLWLAFRAFLNRVGEMKAGYGFLESDIKRICLVVGCGILFIFLFWGFGYFIAIIGTYIAMLHTFGVRKWSWMIGGGIVLAIVFQWLFMGIMLLNDPKGAIVDLRSFTNLISGS